MTWLERYLMLERVFADLDESGENEIAASLDDCLERVWMSLNDEEQAYIYERGNLLSARDLDQFILPDNMLWGPK